jgi:quinol monooxygenase YgiN
MYAVIYHFQVKTGREEEFRRLWRQLTDILRAASQEYGARLHAAEHGVFIAYTQWPSRQAYEKAPPLSPDATRLRGTMLETCEDIRGIHQMEVIEDFLR